MSASWKDCFSEPWENAPYLFFNATMPIPKGHLGKDGSERLAQLTNDNRLTLTEKFAESEVFVSCLENCKNLSAVVKLAYPQLKEVDFEDISLEEQDYIWMNIFWQ